MNSHVEPPESSIEALLGQVADDFTQRLQHGEEPSIEEYARRHPQIAELLRQVLPAVQVMNLSPSRTPSRESDRTDEPAAGTVIGDFRIVRELARGGMGIVYEAEQVSLKRRVALKVLPFAVTLDSSRLHRFHNEAQAAAQLHHTNIVPVYAVGQHHGVHYYAMQFIEGQTLAAVIEQPRSPGTKEFFQTIARWGVQAAEALEHAHQQGVIHRDVKPANLMLDDMGHLWITDFGLARIQTESSLTLTGDLVGTLRYMSPEQALAKRVPIDHRTDVYSLGATLYELLTLQPAFAGRDRQELLSQIAFNEPVPPRRLNKVIPVELETIVLKAMDKEVDPRYATAQELADDLRRYVEDRPIRARPLSLGERLWRWCRRNPLVASLGFAALAALLFAVAVLSASTVLLARKGAEAAKERDEATKQRDIANTQRERAATSELEARQRQYAAEISLAFHLWELGDYAAAKELLGRHRPQADQTDLRGFEWDYLRQLCSQWPVILHGQQGEVYSAAFSDDRKTLATAGQDGTINLWDLPSRQVRATLRGHTDRVNCVTFDGSRLFSASDDRTIGTWDWRNGTQTGHLRGHPDSVTAVISISGAYASAGRSGLLKFWEDHFLDEWRSWRAHREEIRGLALSPDRKLLATASTDGTARVWELATGTEVDRFTHPEGAKELTAVTFPRDGSSVLFTAAGNSGWLWFHGERENPGGRLPHDLVRSLAFSPDGKTLVSAGGDSTIKLWQAGRVWRTLQADSPAHCATFSRDGKLLATTHKDGTVRLWNPGQARHKPQELGSHKLAVSHLAFSSDGDTLWSVSVGAREWDVRSGRLRSDPLECSGSVLAVTCDTSGPLVACTGRSPGTLRLWQPGLNREREITDSQLGNITRAKFSPDGRALVYLSDRNAVYWDLAQDRKQLIQNGAVSDWQLVFSPDGKNLAFGSPRGVVGIWSPETGKSRPTQVAHRSGVGTLAFAPDGQSFATGSGDLTAKMWNTATGAEIFTFQGHAVPVTAVAFSADGRTLATGDWDGSVKLWNLPTYQLLFTLPENENANGGRNTVASLAFSPDGRTLALGMGDGQVRLWRATRRE